MARFFSFFTGSFLIIIGALILMAGLLNLLFGVSIMAIGLIAGGVFVASLGRFTREGKIHLPRRQPHHKYHKHRHHHH